jgi:HEAT repeat protein
MTKESGVLEEIVADIAKAVQAYSEKDPASKRLLEQFCAADAAKFFAAGMRVVVAAEPSEGSRYLLHLLAKDKRLTNWLLDPRACTTKESTIVARAAADARVQVGQSFEMALTKALQNQASTANSDRIMRVLYLLEAIGSQNCWNSFQVELMAYPDKIVRSKAALLIGHSRKNAGWIARRLLDRDPRVQANAVETLWGLDAAEAKPHLLEAVKSKHNRVFGNAALGLYRLGEPSIIRTLLEATQHTDPMFQLSALWAIGQTQDPRFLAALSLQFKSAQGKHRLAIGAAISRIRQREKSGGTVTAIQLDVPHGQVNQDGRRRFSAILSCRPAKNFGTLRPTEFLLWENGSLVDDYQVRPATPPDQLVVGFVAPWSAATDEPMEKALREGLTQCLVMKRADDAWRIDRYAAASSPAGEKPVEGTGTEAKPADDSRLPYDDSLITPQLKTTQGCLADPDQLRKILDSAVPPDRSAPDEIAAIQRQCKAMLQRTGKRHLFVLLAAPDSQNQKPEASAALLSGLAQDSHVVFHGIALGAANQWQFFRDLCLSNSEGSFTEIDQHGIVEGLIRAYSSLANRFEISYTLPVPEPGAARLNLELKIASDRGKGQIKFTLDAPAPAPPPSESAAEPPAPPAAEPPAQTQAAEAQPSAA